MTGARELTTAIDKIIADVDVASQQAVAEGAHALQAQAQRNASGRPGPNVVSGALRSGIVVDGPVRQGLGTFVAWVRSSVVYGRAIEEGHPRWKTGNKFPYLGPAYDFVTKVVLPQLFERAWAAAMRRGT